MALPPPPSTDGSWVTQIRDGVAGSDELRATIDIYDPSTAGYTPYNPLTDTGGPGLSTKVITGREARIQARGEASTDSDSEDGYDAVQRPHLVQFIDQPGDPEVFPGFIVKVTAMEDGGDPRLIGKQMIVEEAGGSSSHAVRTLRCWAVR